MHAEPEPSRHRRLPGVARAHQKVGLEFFDVDLRWGVLAKERQRQTANFWEYCLRWIDRMEPLFVYILGQRYGWVPQSEQLKVSESSSAGSSGPAIEHRHGSTPCGTQ